MLRAGGAAAAHWRPCWLLLAGRQRAGPDRGAAAAAHVPAASAAPEAGDDRRAGAAIAGRPLVLAQLLRISLARLGCSARGACACGHSSNCIGTLLWLLRGAACMHACMCCHASCCVPCLCHPAAGLTQGHVGVDVFVARDHKLTHFLQALVRHRVCTVAHTQACHQRIISEDCCCMASTAAAAVLCCHIHKLPAVLLLPPASCCRLRAAAACELPLRLLLAAGARTRVRALARL